jgi:hypothetical protein
MTMAWTGSLQTVFEGKQYRKIEKRKARRERAGGVEG